jgi:hypothetical protein
MSKKKKLIMRVTSAFALVILALLGSVFYLQANPDGRFAQLLRRQGFPVDAMLDQPQVAAVSGKLSDLIPGLQVQARARGQAAATATPAVFNEITIKGVLGTSSDSTALISAEGKTHWLKVGDQFSVKAPKGTVTVRCEEIRPGFVVLGVANSDLRKEFELR